MASRIAYNMSSGQINTESGVLSYRKMLFSWAFDYYLKTIGFTPFNRWMAWHNLSCNYYILSISGDSAQNIEQHKSSFNTRSVINSFHLPQGLSHNYSLQVVSQQRRIWFSSSIAHDSFCNCVLRLDWDELLLQVKQGVDAELQTHSFLDTFTAQFSLSFHFSCSY